MRSHNSDLIVDTCYYLRGKNGCVGRCRAYLLKN